MIKQTVSVIIVTWNSEKYIGDCLKRVLEFTTGAEIIVVDNMSSDSTCNIVSRFVPSITLLRSQKNDGYSGGNNRGAQASHGEILAFLNPDAFVTESWLEPLVSVLEANKAELACPKVYRGAPEAKCLLDSAGGSIEFPSGEAPPIGYLHVATSTAFDEEKEVAYCPGSVFVIRRTLFTTLSGFDEEFFCYYEETDLAWRARMLGARCRVVPKSRVYHIGSPSFGGTTSPKKLYLQTRNRIRSNLQNLQFPALMQFFIFELLLTPLVCTGALIRPKYALLGRSYILAWVDVLRSLHGILRKRNLRQRQRTVNDKMVLQIHRRVTLFATLSRYVYLAFGKRTSLFYPEG